MPELFRFFELRFFFYSNEHPPIHVHARNGDGYAKIELEPVILIENNGIKSKDIKLAKEIVFENSELIKKRWMDYFNENGE